MRTVYFRSVWNDPRTPFWKWYIHIIDVKGVDGVTPVRIRAIPVFKSTAKTGAFLEETYELRDGKLNLLKTEPKVDPNAPPKRFLMYTG